MVKMIDWKEVEEEAAGDYLKLNEGRTSIEIVGEPRKKLDSWNNTKYVMNVFANNDKTKTFEWSASPRIMKEIGLLFKQPTLLNGKRFVIERKGMSKENTKYVVLSESEKIIKNDDEVV